MSNVFAPDGELEQAYVAAASAAQARWGPVRLVGYEWADALDAAGAAGFTPIGELAVWSLGA